MTFPFDLDKIPIGSHSYNPFANVVLSERGNPSLSTFLTFPFRLKLPVNPISIFL